MKRSYVIVLAILILVIVTLGVLLVMSKQEVAKGCNTCNPNGSNLSEAGESQVEREYDCSFTQTWQIVNLLEGTVGAFPELSYIVVEKYQGTPEVHMITKELKSQLEEGKSYEFTYRMKGTGIVNSLKDVVNYLSFENAAHDVPEGSLVVDLTVKETTRQGMDQLQEPICAGSVVSSD